MSRETHAARKAREAVRDRIREIAWEVAQHVALGDMLNVERNVLPGGWPRFRFSGRTNAYRCECGMAMAPLPTTRGRRGMLPTWFCPVCGLDKIVAVCERIKAEARADQ